jgi:hypothetical protein
MEYDLTDSIFQYYSPEEDTRLTCRLVIYNTAQACHRKTKCGVKVHTVRLSRSSNGSGQHLQRCSARFINLCLWFLAGGKSVQRRFCRNPHDTSRWACFSSCIRLRDIIRLNGLGCSSIQNTSYSVRYSRRIISSNYTTPLHFPTSPRALSSLSGSCANRAIWNCARLGMPRISSSRVSPNLQAYPILAQTPPFPLHYLSHRDNRRIPVSGCPTSKPSRGAWVWPISFFLPRIKTQRRLATTF